MLHCKRNYCRRLYLTIAEAEVSYALFFQDVKISEVFSTKADAWAFAEKNGYVIVVPAHDEDPPRRSLNLSYCIRQVADDPEGRLAKPKTNQST